MDIAASICRPLPSRPTASLINCTAIEFLDLTAALNALDNDLIGSIALDGDPAEINHQSFVEHPRVWATPAIATKTEESSQEISSSIAEQMIDILEHNEPGALLPLAVVSHRPKERAAFPMGGRKSGAWDMLGYNVSYACHR